MKLEDIDTKKDGWTDEELDALVDILVKAEEIKTDSVLYKLVQQHMKKKKKKIDSVADLRAKEQELGARGD